MSLRRASTAWSFSGISFTKDWGNSSRLSSTAATTVNAAAPIAPPVISSTPFKPVYVTVRQARALLPSGVQASKEAVQAVNTFLDELVIRFCGEIPVPVTRASVRITAEHMFLPGSLQEACVRVCTLRSSDTTRRSSGERKPSSRKLDVIERMFSCWVPYTSRAASTSFKLSNPTFNSTLSDNGNNSNNNNNNNPRHDTPMTRHGLGSGSFSSSVAVQQYFLRQPSSGRSNPRESMEDLATCIEEDSRAIMLNGVELCDLFRNRATKTLSFRRSATVRDVSGARMSKRRRRAYTEYLMLLGGIIREVARHLAVELGLHAQRCDRRVVSVRDLLALLDTDPQLESIFRYMQLRDDLRMALYPDAPHSRIIRSTPSFVRLKPGRRDDEAQDIRTQVRRSFMDTEDEEDRFDNNMLRQRRHTLHAVPRASSRRSIHSIASDVTDLDNYYNNNNSSSTSHIGGNASGGNGNGGGGGGGTTLASYHSYSNCISSSKHINNNDGDYVGSLPYSPPSPRSFASRRFHAQRQTNHQFVQVTTSHHGNGGGNATASHSAHSSISTQPLLRYYNSAISSNNSHSIAIDWPPMTLEETEIDEVDTDVPLLPMDFLPSPVIPLELDLFSPPK